MLYFSKRSDRKIAIVGILIFFFLFVIPLLVVENKAAWTSISYSRAYQVDFVLSAGHLQFSTIDPWELMNWPGFFFISACVSAITGLSTLFLADVFPIFVLAFIGIIAYVVLKLKFSSIFSLLGSLLVLASFYTGQEYFSPQATAFIFYLAIILLVGKLFFTKSRSNSLVLCIFLLFIAAVTTHLLTSFIIMAGIIAVYLIRKLFLRKVRLSSFFSLVMCVFFVSIFLFYHAFVINRTFVEVTNSLYNQLLGQDNHITEVAGISQNRVIGSTGYNLEIFGTYGLTIMVVVIALVSLLVVLYGILKSRPEAKSDVFWMAWIVVAAVLGLSVSYGGEGIARAFMFMLLPACYFAVKYLRKKPVILITLIVLLLFVHFPASYTNDNYLYVPSSELKGAHALAAYVPSNSVVFYEFLAPFPYNANESRHFVNIQLLAGFYSLPNSTIIDGALGEATYVVYSSLQNNVYNYFFGSNILDSHNYYQNQTRLYDNGQFKIFSSTIPYGG